jgi:sulfur-carrier protein adenylyltransferase/sulfurtransferase
VLPGIIGVVQATEAIKVLLGIGEPLIGRLTTYDALGMRFREVKLRRDPKCPLCGEHPTIKDLSIHRAGDAAACAADSHAEGNGQPATTGVPAAKAGG